MSSDLVVFGVGHLSRDSISAMAELNGCRLTTEQGSPGGDDLIVERRRRRGYDYAFTVSGPFRVEPEDLPPAIDAIVIGWTWELMVEGSAQARVKVMSKFARQLALECNGVVYDPQEDAVVWPLDRATTPVPPPAETTDVVRLQWCIRREDAPDDVAGVVIDTLATMLPGRFGSFEPFQHRLADSGRDGFVDAWRGEDMFFFWNATPPYLGGSTAGLGDSIMELGQPVPHPVGTLNLTVDARALDDADRRADLEGLFVTMSERTRAFYACADVDRNLEYRSGRLSYTADSEMQTSLVVRNVWMGLPDHEVWLAWYGPLYAGLVQQCLAGDIDRKNTGLFVRASERPGTARNLRPPREQGGKTATNPSSILEVPRDLMLKSKATGRGSSQPPERADRIPDGL